MMNMSSALSAIRANQVALQVIGNNIANANVPGYHRQEVRFAERAPAEVDGIPIGQGVDISHIYRAYNRVTEDAITQNITEQGAVEAQLAAARELEALFTPGQGTVLDRLESLYNELERFTANPDDVATRSIVIRTADGLAEEIRDVAAKLDEIELRIMAGVQGGVADINAKSAEIVKLNLQIYNAQVKGQAPNDLLDQRDRLVNELAQVIDAEIVTIVDNTDGISKERPALALGGGQMLMVSSPVELTAITDGNGNVVLCKRGGAGAMQVHGGKIGGLLEARNLVGSYHARLDEFVQGLVSGFDRVHATGVGSFGNFDNLLAQRNIESATAPLERVDTIVPIEAGTLLIGVTDPNGNRVIEEVSIDPSVDSLNDVAARISAVDNLTGLVVDPPGKLVIEASFGYRFDFMSSRPASIDTSNITGTAIPSVSGHYEGLKNDVYRFEFMQSADVGGVDTLRMQVTDQDGLLVAEYDVGSGYEPDSPFGIAPGVELRLSPGQFNAGDQFSVTLTRQPDETGILAATGMNTLFSGQGSRDFHLNELITNDHSRLATTRSGEPLDSLNAEAMANLRYTEVVADGTQTLEEFLTDIVGSVGSDVLDLTTSQETLATIAENLESERASISGVDVNEEAVKMLQFQRAFQSTARYIGVVDEMLQTLINMLR